MDDSDILSVTFTRIGSGGGLSGSGSSRDSASRDSASASRPTNRIIGKAEMQELIDTAEKNGWDFVRSSSNRPTIVKTDVWKLLGEKKFVARTSTDNAVQVQLTFPAPSNLAADIMVSGYVKGSVVDSRRAFFEKWFTNRMRVIHMEQSGSFGQPVEIAAMIDLGGMNVSKLVFYSYDKATNSYKSIETPKAWVDKKGYLHFTTGYAGDIIISNEPLERK